MAQYPISIKEIVRLLSYASKVEIRAAGGTAESIRDYVVEEFTATNELFDPFVCLVCRDPNGLLYPIRFYRKDNGGAFIKDDHDLALHSNLGPVFLQLEGPMDLKRQVEDWKEQDT
jgi:hypothetical protein